MAVTPKSPAELSALAKDGLRFRRARRKVKNDLHDGNITLGAVLEVGHRGVGDPILGRMRIGQVLNAVPGVGPITVGELLVDLGIDYNTHIDQLTRDQRDIIVMRVGN